MDTVPMSAVPPADEVSARSRRRTPLRLRLLLCLPELALLSVLLTLAVWGGATLSGGTGGGSSAAVPLYSVDQVRAGLLADPAAWVGHTIRVQGVLQGPFVFCGTTNPCPPATLGLVDDGNGILGADQYLPVLRGDAVGVDDLRFNVPATYSVEIQATPASCALNPAILCYEGIIDAALPS